MDFGATERFAEALVHGTGDLMVCIASDMELESSSLPQLAQLPHSAGLL